jgi:HSP20 family protein
MELEQREPSTRESTYPFPRHFGLADMLDRWEPLRWFAEQRDAMAIPVEEFVEDDHLVVRAELPGVDPEEDIAVSVDAGLLHIRAERREQHADDKPDRYRSEWRYGAFSRTIRLPADAGAADVDASYEDGILTVRLPIDRDRGERTRVQVRRA